MTLARTAGCALFLALTVALAACGGGAEGTASTMERSAAQPLRTQPAAARPAPPRCIKVPGGMVQRIEWRLLVPDGWLRGARAVRSRDFKSAYFVSAEVEGRGRDGSGDIATWVTYGLRTEGRYFRGYAVGRLANELSMAGAAEAYSPRRESMKNDGARESVACAAHAARTTDKQAAPPSKPGRTAVDAAMARFEENCGGPGFYDEDSGPGRLRTIGWQEENFGHIEIKLVFAETEEEAKKVADEATDAERIVHRRGIVVASSERAPTGEGRYHDGDGWSDKNGRVAYELQELVDCAHHPGA